MLQLLLLVQKPLICTAVLSVVHWATGVRLELGGVVIQVAHVVLELRLGKVVPHHDPVKITAVVATLGSLTATQVKSSRVISTKRLIRP